MGTPGPSEPNNFLHWTQEISSYDSVGTLPAASATAYSATRQLSLGRLQPNGVYAGVMGHFGPARFRAFCFSNEAVTLEIEQSPDGVNWFVTATASITANATLSAPLEALVCLPYVRAAVVAGATAPTVLEFDTCTVAV